METQNINNDIANLPPEAQRQIFDFIEFIKVRYPQKHPTKKTTRNKIIQEPFIGIWEGRNDMNDSSQWVNNLRKTEWGAG